MAEQKFTVYDKKDQTTWPPSEGYDLLVCYMDGHGNFQWVVTWNNYGSGHDYAAFLPEDIGTDWADSSVQRSDWVAWRLLDEKTDAPTSFVAVALRSYYGPREVVS